VISRRAASEFPNDNPELHDGLVWACPEPRGRALPTLRMRPLAGALPKVLVPVWEVSPATDVPASKREAAAPGLAVAGEPTPLEPAAAPALAPPPAPAPVEPFDVFVRTVARVAMDRGATRAAAAVTALLTVGRLQVESVDRTLLEGLVARRVLAPGSGQASPELSAATRAWRAVLDGSEGDLSGCGSATLDTWAAELLAAVMNAKANEVGELRRELRRSGIAAFGLLAVA